VAQNRRGIPREERLDSVVAAARHRFETLGYKGTSIGDVARDVGVNTGSIHWYFPSKDDLFAAVLRRIAEESRASVDADLASGVAPMDALVRFLTSAERYRGIHVDAHDRVAESSAVSDVHDELHQWLDELLLAIVQPRLGPSRDVGLIADTAHVVFEGLLGSTMRRDRPFEEIVQFLVDMLVAAASQAARPAGSSNHPQRARRSKVK
jgi:AcrR family transcriptional regulator